MNYNDIIWVHFTQFFFYLNPTNFPIFALVALGINLDDKSNSRTIYISLTRVPNRIPHAWPRSHSGASID
jgi:hypothetical protein